MIHSRRQVTRLTTYRKKERPFDFFGNLRNRFKIICSTRVGKVMLKFMGREEEVAEESQDEAVRLFVSRSEPHHSGGGAQVAHLRQLAIDGEARSLVLPGCGVYGRAPVNRARGSLLRVGRRSLAGERAPRSTAPLQWRRLRRPDPSCLPLPSSVTSHIFNDPLSPSLLLPPSRFSCCLE